MDGACARDRAPKRESRRVFSRRIPVRVPEWSATVSLLYIEGVSIHPVVDPDKIGEMSNLYTGLITLCDDDRRAKNR